MFYFQYTMYMETLILSLFVIFFSLERIVSCGLNELNLRHLSSRKIRAPDFFSNSIDDKTYRKSVAYTLDKGKFSRWSLVYDIFITLWILFGGVLPWLEQWSGSYNFNSIITGILFIFGLGAISSVLGLPLG